MLLCRNPGAGAGAVRGTHGGGAWSGEWAQGCCMAPGAAWWLALVCRGLGLCG